MRDSRNIAKLRNSRRRGGAGLFQSNFLTNTTPAPIKRWATPLDSTEEGSFRDQLA